MAAESVLGLPAVRPALLDNVSVTTRRRPARAACRGTESGCAWDAPCAVAASSRGSANGGTCEARSC